MAVKQQMMSDVPLGILLSGGIDSTIVALCMSKACKTDIKTFSIGFKEKCFDETFYSQKVADALKTDHRKEIVSQDSLQSLDLLTQIYDEPFADPSAIPTYCISKLARRHITVALSGDGGDEGFGGYERYYKSLFYKKTIDAIPYTLRTAVFNPVNRVYPDHWKGKGFLERLLSNSQTRYKHLMTQFDTLSLFSKDFIETIGDSYENPFFFNYFGKLAASGYLTQMQYVDTKTYLPEDILTKVDRPSMAVSLEVRVPLLDHTILELASTIPAEMKIRGYTTKFILRKILMKYFDSQFVNRKKMGFGIPIGMWFKHDLKKSVQNVILDDDDGGIFNKKYLKALILSHGKGFRNLGGKIYTLLFFKLWLKKVSSS